MNFELLRPFSLTDARDGHPMVINGTNPQTRLPCIIPCVLVAEGGSNMEHCVRLTMERGRLYLAFADQLRMAPLGWLEGRPVYLRDALWTKDGRKHYADKMDNTTVYQQDPRDDAAAGAVPIEYLTWTKPVRYPARKVWVNVYPEHYKRDGTMLAAHATKERADKHTDSSRLACIEIELPEIA